ncbi:hypothetical protein OY671_011990 [Metschnikowia pulcherrima]|nr:hypothetical protein OY671_011990 [Metschnikowia pulcherrima]
MNQRLRPGGLADRQKGCTSADYAASPIDGAVLDEEPVDPESPGKLPSILCPYLIPIWIHMDSSTATSVQARPVHTERNAPIGSLSQRSLPAAGARPQQVANGVRNAANAACDSYDVRDFHGIAPRPIE